MFRIGLLLWIFGFAFVRMWNRTSEFYMYDLVEVLDDLVTVTRHVAGVG